MIIKTIFAATVVALTINSTHANDREPIPVTAAIDKNIFENDPQPVPKGMENGISQAVFLKYVRDKNLAPLARGEDIVSIFNTNIRYTIYFLANEQSKEWIIASDSDSGKMFVAQWGHEYNAMLDRIGTTPVSFQDSPDFDALCPEHEHSMGNNTLLAVKGKNALGNDVALFTEPLPRPEATWILMEQEVDDGHECYVVHGINFEKANPFQSLHRQESKVAKSRLTP